MRERLLSLAQPKYLGAACALALAALALICSLPPASREGVSGFEFVQVGDTRDQVRALMGAPFVVEMATCPNTHVWGPPESLCATLGSGSSYEEWRWEDKTHVYHIFFASPAGEPVDRWCVVNHGKYPHGAVFEPRAP